jgi:hypothetical protein
MDLLVSGAQPIKFGSQPPCNAVAPVDKTGMDFHASPVQLDKTGTLLPEHVDAQPVKTGMEVHAFHASVEGNGTLFQDNVLVPLEAGTDSLAFNAQLDKPGTHQAFHVHAHQAVSGTALTAEFAQVQTDSGTSNLTIVSAEQETGMAHNALSAQPTATGTEELAFLALEEESGTQLI